MSANVAIVRRVYELAGANWEARDSDAQAAAAREVLDLFDPDVVLEEQATFPDARAYRGHAGVLEWWTAFYEVYDEIRLEPQRLTPVDDRVLVEIRMWLKSKAGVGLWLDTTHLFRLRDGKVVHVTGYKERADALAAAGLAEA